MSDLAPGTRLGDLEVVRLIGRGGMGAVYEARNVHTDERVALKLVADVKGDARERFVREARAARAITHPGVVRVVDSGDLGGRPWIAFELVRGGSLEERIARTGALPWREVARMGLGLARALEAVHGAKLVHRDLKPANVLLDDEGRPKLADFGLVRPDAAGAGNRLTRTGEVVGTFQYAPPEQVEGGRAVDARADLYALGATLYAALTGKPPFDGEGYALVKKVLFEIPERPGAVARDVPPALDQLIARLLAKDPAARPASASEVAGELAALATAEAPRGRRSSVALVGGALVLVLGGAGAFVVSRGAAAPLPPPHAPPTNDPKPAPTEPAWFLALSREERPARPLPPGVKVGTAKGEYLHEPSKTVLVFVPGATFRKGSARLPEFFDAQVLRDVPVPLHAVQVGSFFLGKYEVSNAEYAAAVEKSPELFKDFERSQGGEKRGPLTKEVLALDPPPANGRAVVKIDQMGVPGATWRDPRALETTWARDNPDHPVVQVSWLAARAYAGTLGAKWRLPTEAEWERAARHPASGVSPDVEGPLFPWGDEVPGKGSPPRGNLADETVRHGGWAVIIDDWDPVHYAFDYFEGYVDGAELTAPVRQDPGATSKVGAVHLIGNVAEWCWDVFVKDALPRSVDSADAVGASRPSAEIVERVHRGGSFCSARCESTCVGRAKKLERASADDVGFRVALPHPAEAEPKR